MSKLTKPRSALEKAKKEICILNQADTIHEYDDIWKNFLNLYDKVWNKTHNLLNGYSKYQGWKRRGEVKDLRKKDPLLSYLKNARGADHHTVNDITKKEYGRIDIKPGESGSVHIKEMRINNKGNIYMDADDDVEIEFNPGNVKLLPVENRGDLYEVPQKHLGKELKSMNPYRLGRKAIEFLEGYLESAKDEVI